MHDERPNPDELLDKIQREESHERRGRLKIFFGACAGVGKTYSMLLAAKTLRKQNKDLIIGLVETHGRAETAELLAGFEILPPKMVSYHHKFIAEFDLEAALVRKPALIIVDELAHSNVSGLRHRKRWQDVEELLAAGIDVYTTVNVQHLESLNDIVNHITDIRVYETLPDQVFDSADEIILVDLPPDELLTRLKEGKVYLPKHIQRAAENFFRKGNLIALRELALRRMADRIDMQMREYRANQDIQHVWQVKERILVCIGPKANNEAVIRHAYRLANRLQADWLAVYVETPRLQKMSKVRRGQILKDLKLAQELGAETTTLSSTHLAATIIDYARRYNASKIIVGKSRQFWLSRLWRPTLSEQLIHQANDIDVYTVGQIIPAKEGKTQRQEKQVTASALGHPELVGIVKHRGRRYGWATLIGLLISLLSFDVTHYFSLINIAMLYLLGTVFIAMRYGYGPSVWSAIFSVVALDFFVPPKFTFSISDTQYLFTFAVMLLVGLVLSRLTSNLRFQAHIAMHRERRTKAIYALNKELSACMTILQIVAIGKQHLQSVFQAKVAILLPDSHDKVQVPVSVCNEATDDIAKIDSAIAQWVYDHQQAAGFGTQTLPASSVLYIPLTGAMRTRGVLGVIAGQLQQIFLPEQQRLLENFTAQIGLALERIHYIEVARDALLAMESERLRNVLLSTVSNNLRIPLNDILELSQQLASDSHLSATAQRELAESIHNKSLFMYDVIVNLVNANR